MSALIHVPPTPEARAERVEERTDQWVARYRPAVATTQRPIAGAWCVVLTAAVPAIPARAPEDA